MREQVPCPLILLAIIPPDRVIPGPGRAFAPVSSLLGGFGFSLRNRVVRSERFSTLTRRERKEAIEFYIGIAPWLIGLVFFTGGPILASFVIRFTKWRLLSPPEWIGLQNYIGMFQDEGTRVSLGNTLFYTGLSVPLGLATSLFVALLLNQRVRGSNWFAPCFTCPPLHPVWPWLSCGYGCSIRNSVW